MIRDATFTAMLFTFPILRFHLCLYFSPPSSSPAHTPDNSFMGFVSEELNETEKHNIQQNKVKNMAVAYGKEASMWKVRRRILEIKMLTQKQLSFT